MMLFGSDDELARQIRQLGLDAHNLEDEEVPGRLERLASLLEAARHRVC
jgi:hypothetical protein